MGYERISKGYHVGYAYGCLGYARYPILHEYLHIHIHVIEKNLSRPPFPGSSGHTFEFPGVTGPLFFPPVSAVFLLFFPRRLVKTGPNARMMLPWPASWVPPASPARGRAGRCCGCWGAWRRPRTPGPRRCEEIPR